MTDPARSSRPRAAWRERTYRVIFEHDTPAGKAFDVVLILAILLSVVVVMVESVPEVRARSGATLRAAEWLFTILFTIEYGARLLSARGAGRYARSFFGIVDLLSILPTYVSVLVPGGQAFTVIRILRVLRVFRVLKLARFVGGERLLVEALRGSLHKIVVFLVAVVTVVVIVGSVMYFVESAEAGFTSIPRAVYWAIVTLTTVGFGDITPQTSIGQVLASMLMILGYGIIAVPTGIVTVEMASARSRGAERVVPAARPAGTAAGVSGCPACGSGGHEADAAFCRRCGAALTGGHGP